MGWVAGGDCRQQRFRVAITTLSTGKILHPSHSNTRIQFPVVVGIGRTDNGQMFDPTLQLSNIGHRVFLRMRRFSIALTELLMRVSKITCLYENDPHHLLSLLPHRRGSGRPCCSLHNCINHSLSKMWTMNGRTAHCRFDSQHRTTLIASAVLNIISVGFVQALAAPRKIDRSISYR